MIDLITNIDVLKELEAVQEEVSYLRTRETNHMAYIAELEERQAEIERLREALKDIWHRAPTNGEDVSFAIANKALAEVNDE
jgi:predicted  nucleic acid-binding Zn-ribbon protein